MVGIDVTLPRSQIGLITEKNYPEYFNSWIKILVEDINSFSNGFDGKDFVEGDFEKEEVNRLILITMDWMSFIGNCFLASPIPLSGDLDTFPITRALEILRSTCTILIQELDKFQRVSSGNYALLHMKDISMRIFEEIKRMNDSVVEAIKGLSRIKQDTQKLSELFFEISDILDGLRYLYPSLPDIAREYPKYTALEQSLSNLQMNSVIDRIQLARESFNQKRWDKSVQDIRLALELTVTSLVRRIQENSNWKGPMKDGLEILYQKGIITDKIMLNHLRVRDIGIYAILSIKGCHADGDKTENLADSDLEAQYWISLTENVMEYLLKSFNQSEHSK